MDIRECYQVMDSNFDDVLERLGSESFIRRFTLRFLDDPSFQTLKDGIMTGDHELAFRGAHTLKGVCSNLGFTKLYELSSELTEILRKNTGVQGCEGTFAAVEKQYQKMTAAIKELEA